MSDTIAGVDDELPPLRYSSVVGRLTVLREYAIVVSTVVLFLVLTFTSDVFFTKLNLLNILEQQAPVGIVAFALTLVIIGGEFDLAAGAIFVLTGIVATRLHADFGTYPALLVGIAVATACGAVNGLLVAYVKVNSFVCTLATSIIVFGVTLAITKGKLITITESSYGTLGGAKLFGVKYSIWILLTVGLLCGFVLSRTKFGRRLFAVGGNPEAATAVGHQRPRHQARGLRRQRARGGDRRGDPVVAHRGRPAGQRNPDRVRRVRRGGGRWHERGRRTWCDLADCPRRAVPGVDHQRLQPARRQTSTTSRSSRA